MNTQIQTTKAIKITRNQGKKEEESPLVMQKERIP
jgi:hypothetical protein